MYSDNSRYGPPPATTSLGRVPWQGTTVNPADIWLAQPPYGPTYHGIPFNDDNFGRYPTVNDAVQEAPQRHPPTWPSQNMGHPSGQSFFVEDVPVGHFTGPSMTDKQPFFCQWVSENGSICGQMTGKGTVSGHLARHGIENMHSDLIVRCRWHGCGIPMKRQSITRHYREVHLGFKRKSHKHVSP